MHNWQNDMAWSTPILKTLVWDAVAPHIGGGELVVVEGRGSPLADLMDIFCGIDALQVTDHGARGIASRVQEVDSPWNTFTVRLARDSGATTEFEKRMSAISADGMLYPYWTIQAYVARKTGPLLSVGVARTSDIMRHISFGLAYGKRTHNATFAYVSWSDMVSRGYPVHIYPDPDMPTPPTVPARFRKKTKERTQQ